MNEGYNLNLLGIDFEDWYHPELVSPHISKEKKIPTMFKGLDKILNLLKKNDSKATFFLVGEILENNPDIHQMMLFLFCHLEGNCLRFLEIHLNFLVQKVFRVIDLVDFQKQTLHHHLILL